MFWSQKYEKTDKKQSANHNSFKGYLKVQCESWSQSLSMVFVGVRSHSHMPTHTSIYLGMHTSASVLSYSFANNLFATSC